MFVQNTAVSTYVGWTLRGKVNLPTLAQLDIQLTLIEQPIRTLWDRRVEDHPKLLDGIPVDRPIRSFLPQTNTKTKPGRSLDESWTNPGRIPRQMPRRRPTHSRSIHVKQEPVHSRTENSINLVPTLQDSIYCPNACYPLHSPQQARALVEVVGGASRGGTEGKYTRTTEYFQPLPSEILCPELS